MKKVALILLTLALTASAKEGNESCTAIQTVIAGGKRAIPDALKSFREGTPLAALSPRHGREINSLNQEAQPTLSIYTFPNLYAFAPVHKTRIGTIDGGVLIQIPGARPRDRNIFLEPLGGSPQERARRISMLLREFPSTEGKPNVFLNVSEEVAEHLRGDASLRLKEVPEKNEYVYESRDLATLSGKKLDNQRRNVSALFEMFPDKGPSPRSQYVELDKLTRSQWLEYVPKLKEFIKEWRKNRKGNDRTDFAEELETVDVMINNFMGMKLKGGALLVDGKIVAFTFGKQVNEQTNVVYTEKALTELGGVKIEAYKAVAQRFAMATVKDSLRQNPSTEARKLLEKILVYETLEGLQNVPLNERLSALSNSPILQSSNLEGLMPFNEALSRSRGVDLQKALSDPEAMRVWESIKLRELVGRVKRGQPGERDLASVQEMLRAQIREELGRVQGPFLRFTNRQEDGGETGHQTPKKQLGPIPGKGKNYAVQSATVPDLDWKIYESER